MTERPRRSYASGEAQGVLTRVGRFLYDFRGFRVISVEYWEGAAAGRALHRWLIPRRCWNCPACKERFTRRSA